LAKRREKTAKASRVRAKRNPRRVSPGKISSAAAARASQANRRNLVKAKDVAKQMSRRTILSDRAARGNSPVRANRRRVSPMDNLVPGRDRACQAKNPTSSSPPRQHRGRADSDRIRTTGIIVAAEETTTAVGTPAAPTCFGTLKTLTSMAR